MDYTAIAATVNFADVLVFLTAAVTAAFAVRVALKGVGFVKSALTKS